MIYRKINGQFILHYSLISYLLNADNGTSCEIKSIYFYKVVTIQQDYFYFPNIKLKEIF